MRENAEAAGFNPLTALRAGGGAGFTTTHHPALSSGEFIAQAIGGIGNAIASIDPMRDATAKLEHEIKQATLANIQADTASRLRATQSIGGAPVSTGARNVTKAVPDLYTKWRDNSPTGAGQMVWLPNADLPDGEQILVPPFATAKPGEISGMPTTPGNAFEKFKKGMENPISVKKLPADQKSWWPTFDIKWR